MSSLKVSFINFSPLALGPRIISNYLRSKGYETQMLFFPDSRKKINTKLLENICSIVKGSSLIGISIMCIDYLDAIKVTEYLKKRLDTPLIWGGPEVVANPEACIRYADIICTGEGEETMLQLMEKIEKNFLDIPNTWIKKDGKIIKNPSAKLITDLDKYPIPDYDITNHYIYNKNLNIFKKMSHTELYDQVFYNKSLIYGNFKTYHTMTVRGCPNRCTYCGNNILRKRYKGKYVRRRSVSNVIDELKWAKSKFGIDDVFFRDDNFMVRTEDEIIEFSKRYKKEIGLPFFTSCSPLTLNEKKLKLLLDCGLTHVKIGVQSGSERILKDVYKRPINNKTVLEVANILHKYRRKFKRWITYDFIFDNPFENIDDQIETLKLITHLPRPCKCLYHTLIFLPGTEMYSMAEQAGFIHDETSQVYKKGLRFGGRFNYVRFFCASYPIIPFRIPKFISNFLISKKVVTFLQHQRFDKMFKYLTIATFFSKYSIQMFIHRILCSKFSIKETKDVFITVYKYFLNPEKKF